MPSRISKCSSLTGSPLRRERPRAGSGIPSHGTSSGQLYGAPTFRVFWLTRLKLPAKVRVMATRTRKPNVPPGYDASKFPAFAVTVDVVILTMAEGVLHLLLVRRGEEPFKGMWAIPGGFKRPEETLDEAARRELSEETGVDVPSLLTQFGAYGDPARDPRMNVVTVAYLAVLRDVGAIAAGTDAAHAALVPASDILEQRVELAFDHLQIVRDAVERVRVELELSGIATAFVGTTFTMAELRAVYEAIWGVQLDAANFRRSLVGEDG